MKIEIEDVDSCNKKVKVGIPHHLYQERLDSYLKELGRDATMPGFRKGKIPKSMLEKRVGPEAKKEVLGRLVSECVIHAIEEKGIRAAGMPTIQEVQAEEGADINVSASVEVFPEFTVKDYSDIELNMRVNKVTGEDVDKVVEFYRNRAAKSTTVTDRPARDEDYLKIDYKGTLDGKPFKGGEGKDHILQMGSKMFLEGFEEGLIGMNIGETRKIKINTPENYPGKEIAGKTVDFQVTLQGIQVKELPEANDEFARIADPEKKFETLADMRDKIHKRLEEEEKKASKKIVKKQLAEKLVELNPVDIPEILIQEQIRALVDQSQTGQGQTGQPGPQQFAEQDPPVSAEDQQVRREFATKVLRQELIINQLTEDLDIQVGESELNQEVKDFLKLVGGNNPNKVRQDWQKNGTLERLQIRMVREKTLDKLLEKIHVKEEMVDREKVIADNG